MNENDRDIDALLRRNVEKQLAGFDWEALRRGIDSRLVGAGATTGSRIRWGKWGAMAAAVALTAGVLVLAVLSTVGSGPGDSIASEARVAMIETARAIGTARVAFSPADKPVRCEVTILTSDRPRQDSRARPSWCIIAGRESVAQRPYTDLDVLDVLCLF